MLRCIVERITYQNSENGFCVLKTKVKGYYDLVTVVGNLCDVTVGAVLLVWGDWKIDRAHGRQFVVTRWEEKLPATIYGLEKYLGSGLIKGIGPKYAKRIVTKFGLETLEVIEATPEKLSEIEGIGPKRIERIKDGWVKQKEIKNVMLFLQSNGVSTAFATKIWKTYGNESIEKVKTNPYCLADDIWGIGFKTADTIAEKLGFTKDHPLRCRSGILYTLSQLGNDGHVYAEHDQLVKKGIELLDVASEPIENAIGQMLSNKDLIAEDEAIYMPPFYYAEKGVAEKLLNILNTPLNQSKKEISIEAIEQQNGYRYDSIQADAIREAIKSKVMVLTGGPGTGKTTTLKGVLSTFDSLGLNVLLAAPTGRAAKRLSESTGREAKTIHRLLEFKPPEGYQRNEQNPLEGDALILDECSMIDVVLMNSLLKAMPPTMRLVLVGDIDQLPSVGAGNVLRDIIQSGVIPVIRLTRIFRQAQTSRIIMNAHRINKGQMPDISNGRTSDFFFMSEDNPEKAAQLILELVKKKLPSYYKVDLKSIQVLTPMQRGIVGAASLNQTLQAVLNPGEGGLQRGGISYRIHDRVMQIKNNYDKEVFNGDIGTIESVDEEEKTLSVRFENRLVSYEQSDLDELVLAYATTIHKSQGSEYPIVVMPLMMTHYVMLQRNLVYTGVTRAKKICVVVGTKKALAMAIRNMPVTHRNSKLSQRLSGKTTGLTMTFPLNQTI